MLYSWIREHKNQEKAFPGKGVVSRDEELHKLRQELKRVTEERDFLKKTAAFFARESK
jgi:transposase